MQPTVKSFQRLFRSTMDKFIAGWTPKEVAEGKVIGLSGHLLPLMYVTPPKRLGRLFTRDYTDMEFFLSLPLVTITPESHSGTTTMSSMTHSLSCSQVCQRNGPKVEYNVGNPPSSDDAETLISRRQLAKTFRPRCTVCYRPTCRATIPRKIPRLCS